MANKYNNTYRSFSLMLLIELLNKSSGVTADCYQLIAKPFM